MANKPPYTIADQIALLTQRGMSFRNVADAPHHLENISYYRLKGYWWDTQTDTVNHIFRPGTYFEDIIERYNFDRQLRLILFDAIERIEIALRAKMIHHLSLSYSGLWYLDAAIFENTVITFSDGSTKTAHQNALEELQKEFNRSKDIFVQAHKSKYQGQDPEAWKILEVASFGTLSKLYKALKNQLPEKTRIAKEMGLNLDRELSSWLEAINYTRNIIAHHSRMWSRNMVKTPVSGLRSPIGQWFVSPITQVQRKKPFLIITCMLYLCNQITPGHQLKIKILDLFALNPNIPIYKLGFVNNWQNEPIWTR